jgi:hypothetical protein
MPPLNIATPRLSDGTIGAKEATWDLPICICLLLFLGGDSSLGGDHASSIFRPTSSKFKFPVDIDERMDRHDDPRFFTPRGSSSRSPSPIAVTSVETERRDSLFHLFKIYRY